MKLVVRALNDEWLRRIGGSRKAVDPRALLLLVKRFQTLENAIADQNIPLFWYEGRSLVDNPDLMRMYRAVNRALSRYTARPIILPTYMSDLKSDSRTWELDWARVGGSSQPFMEVALAMDVVTIASMGRINSLKQCEKCRKWLFARFPHQRFCSIECKDGFHASNEADKTRRREWARANYQSRKELELGSRKAAAQKKRGKR